MYTKRCAYLTMDDLGDFVSDADLSIAPMAARGWDVDMVSWRNEAICWDDYDAVYICTPWDYQDDPDRFIGVLERIDQSNARLVNDLALVRWSIAKDYLRELESRGALIVPSRWYDNIKGLERRELFRVAGANKIVVKPLVGGNASDTFVLENAGAVELEPVIRETFAAKPFFVQPFVAIIVNEGELSLFVFAGKYSHALVKVPKPGDFRVQEEHGADIRAAEPSADLIATAGQVLSLVEPSPVYVRADFVRNTDGRFLLMELELIEPALYFRMDAGAADRFAAAFDAYARAD